jgi:acyl carrier protein
MPQLLLIGGLVAALAALVWLDSSAQVRAARRHITRREPLSAPEFGIRLFTAQQAPIAARLRELLAEATVLDLARLRPEDRLAGDLRIDALDSLALTEFVLAIEQEYRIDLPDAEVAEIRTFGALVELVSRQVTAPGTA